MREESNEVILSGKVISLPEVWYKSYGEEYFLFKIRIIRLSGEYDDLYISVNQDLLPNVEEGRYITINGVFRRYNFKKYRVNDNLNCYVFAKKIEKLKEEKNSNYCRFEGTIKEIVKNIICKSSGKRLIEFIIHNRSGKTYTRIWCTAWEENAEKMEKYLPEEKIVFTGSIESRYIKKNKKYGITVIVNNIEAI